MNARTDLARLALLTALTWLVSSCASKPETTTSRDFTMQVRNAEGYIVHEVWLADAGPFWCVLDTGNAQTVVFERVAEQLELTTEPLGEMGGAGPGFVPVRATHDLKVSLRGEDAAEVSFVEPTAIVLPDAATLPDIEGRRIDAFLGASLIERYATTIDYPNSQVRLRQHSSYDVPDGAQILPISLTAGFPHFQGRVVARRAGVDTAPIEGNFLLDLGAAYSVQVDADPARERGLLDGEDPERRTEGTIMGIDGVTMDILSVPATSVVMGGISLDLPRVLVVPSPSGGPPIDNLVGNVGSAYFRTSALTLDYPGKRVIVEPADAPSSD